MSSKVDIPLRCIRVILTWKFAATLELRPQKCCTLWNWLKENTPRKRSSQIAAARVHKKKQKRKENVYEGSDRICTLTCLWSAEPEGRQLLVCTIYIFCIMTIILHSRSSVQSVSFNKAWLVRRSSRSWRCSGCQTALDGLCSRSWPAIDNTWWHLPSGFPLQRVL